MSEKKKRPYGICAKCGKYYTSFIGSMAHASGACDKVIDRKPEFEEK